MLIKRMLMAFGVAALAAGPALAHEEKVDLAKVPAPAVAAAKKVAPAVKWTGATKETEEGKVLYELSGKDAAGTSIEVEVTADGKVQAVETEIPLSKVPKVVLDALKAKGKGFKASSAEEVRKDGKLTSYEFDGKDKDGKEVEATVSADGKTVEFEDED